MAPSTSTSPPAGAPRSVPIRVQLLGATAEDKLDVLQALLFDRLGKVVASSALKLSR